MQQMPIPLNSLSTQGDMTISARQLCLLSGIVRAMIEWFNLHYWHQFCCRCIPNQNNFFPDFVSYRVIDKLCSFLSAYYHKRPTDYAFAHSCLPWWRYEMETFSALLALCAGNSPVTGEFPSQRPVTRSFDVFFNLRLNKRLSKHWWGWWFETPSPALWRLCDVNED